MTRAEATAIPVHPFGAYGLPPVGKRTINDRTAARFPLQGSNAIGLGRDRYVKLNKNNIVIIVQGILIIKEIALCLASGQF